MGNLWAFGIIFAGAMGPLVAAAATAVPARTETAIYVAPTGNDAWSGTRPAATPGGTDGPVATLQRARDLLRSLKMHPRGSLHVYVRGGTYSLDEPLTLTPLDSGSAEAPVTWSAYQDERPILSGGRRITAWKPTTINGHAAWTTLLPAGVDAPSVRVLWLDDQRLTRARWPAQGTLRVAAPTQSAAPDKWSAGWNVGGQTFSFAHDDVPAWPNLKQGEAVVASRWVESHLPLAAVEAADHTLRFTKKSVFRVEPGDQYWIENVPETLTEPGTFCVDLTTRVLTLLPPAGVDLARATVIVPHLAQVLRLEGDAAAGQFLEHVTFAGLGFAHTGWDFGAASGQSGFPQAAIGVPGAIVGHGVRDCTFERCTIAHVGTYGLELAQGCQHNHITRCTLTDLGAGGIKLGETSVRDNQAQQTFSNEIADCTLTDGGNIFTSAVGVWLGQTHDNTLTHNDIHDFYYTGISLGWTWGYGPALSQHNIVEHNHVHHIGAKTDGGAPLLSDMGAIYTLGDQTGTILRDNLFHDVAADKYGGWGIYFDEGTSHITAEHNLVYRTTHGGFHQHYGRENIVRNNLFAFGRDAQIQRTRVEDHQSFRFEDNIVLWAKGPLLAGDWSKLNAVFDHNTYWRQAPGPITFGPMTWQQWQAAGMDPHSTIADPHLANPAADDFTLTPASADALAGFQPLDLSTVGPRPQK